MRALIHPDRTFTARRQLSRLREETARARWEGYAGLRTFIDMAWVRDLGMDVEAVMRREKTAGGLFASRRYAEICSYDRRSFAPAVVEEMRVSHPVALLERPGELQAWHSSGEVHLIGDGDLLTRQRFRDAIRAVVGPARAADRGVGAGGPVQAVLPVRGLRRRPDAPGRPGRRARARGGPLLRLHARTLRHLGAAGIGRLVLDELAEDR